ncbi:acyl-CoA carboxylase epsilon subunit-like protein [Micromonospora sp. Llam0]|uniref:acyl-CoA carboxylase subunit epsilon n=1 Tax=Micromonospora sp. Llam0 TaxID=2485143 RepID=UPI000F4844DB|nr:acyl-CoA carboxylase subunit epsilon [Micromonospora sp. Llam0]ROO50931.1 acyl-CoA carboxylase epsilon subunit-like protein [Micromonospora sp. Llam0]
MSDAEPAWRIVRGTPTPEELAALVGVLVARTRPVADSGTDRPAPSRWARSARPTPGFPGRLGPDAWRASALPH